MCLFWRKSVCCTTIPLSVSLFCQWWALGIDILNNTEGFFLMLLLIFVSLKENECLDYILSRLLSHFLSNKHFFKQRVTKF